MAHVRREGRIRIGYAIEPPYAGVNERGEPSGESPRLAQEVARRLGIARVHWRLVSFDALIDGLEAEHFDVIAAGMFVTPERARRVAFSRPTLRVRGGMLVRRGDTQISASPEALWGRRDLRFAVLSGSVEEAALRRRVPASQVRVVPEARNGASLVALGGADGLLLSRPTVRYLEAHGGGRFEARTVEVGDGAPGVVAFAFRREDTRLRAAWDEALAGLLGTETHRALVQAEGFEPGELVGRP